ncbi:MAG: DUF4280 domain-containing protein [Lachnospiraceae bacterium]|nr:DUF4280 domain-containing protein [Lachnospiraceae bacterium]
MATAMGANLMCTFGTAPAPLKVTQNTVVLTEGKPAATIMDAASMTNVGPFGMCTTLSNPQVASATAAALGVLTPQPCIPQTASFIPTSTKVIIGGKPCLTQDCKLVCAYAGQISIVVPGQTKVTVS